MFKFIAKRLVQAVVVLFVIITVTFFMVRFAPGDPFSAERKMPEHIKQRLMAHYGLDQPVMVQYANYLGQLVKGDLGPSFTETRSVNQILAASFPVSFELGAWALLISLGIGLPIGIVAAVYRNTLADYVPMSLAMIGICLPTFVLGPILALVFGVWLGWFNVSGWFVPADRVLPALTIGLVYAAVIARITRGGMLEVLSQDFIRTAVAKGVPFWRVIVFHTLKGGLLPVVTFLGPALAGIISGSFVVETIFQIPGMGREFVSSAFDRDYTLVLGTVILYAVLITAANLLVDIVQVILNPRLRFEDS
ncbi:ABC transporter permease [Puniceicoccales bacterium CK1056]|uniref:ABC transporter permease n=1 Tax=Oceanipulchritudo coccoides TaxID=2706888 RepID=A0A6B2LYU9_9BACT|nr:ABC transporter permease [Oceanipulchritudo coccoides]NDV60947.1 ABC transporter permease [Oceanipulchritudo coccoides]